MVDAAVAHGESRFELRYSLGEEDFLAYQMYSSGESAHQKKARRRNRILIPVFYGIVSAVFFSLGDLVGGVVFVVLAILWFLLYPTYTKWSHTRHFQRHIRETYKEKVRHEATVQLDEQGLVCNDLYGEDRLKLSSVSHLVELEKHFLIHFKQANALIIPKERIGQADLRDFMEEVCRRTGLQVKDHRKVKWS